jgi:hypothetical protein
LSAPDLRSPFQGYLVALDLLARSKSAGDNEAQIAAAEATLDLSVDRLRTLGVLEDATRRGRAFPADPRRRSGSRAADGFRPGAQRDRRTDGRSRPRAVSRRRSQPGLDHGGRVRPRGGRRRSGHGGHRARARPAARSPGARVSTQVLPQFDAATQAVRVRIDADNPGYVLRPDMSVDVDLRVGGADDDSWCRPDAVRDAGLEQLVFVERRALASSIRAASRPAGAAAVASKSWTG